MLLRNARIITLDSPDSYGKIETGAIRLAGDSIAWVGREDELNVAATDSAQIDLEGRTVTPALIDCHTHVVYGGHRAAEFEQRLSGASYEEIARAGGGINSTVRATRQSSCESLIDSALVRIDALLAEGVSTIEIKSGYGLDRDSELNMLRAAKAVEDKRPVRVRTSYLGAHAIPPEFQSNPDAYIDDVCIPTLREAHDSGLVDAVDGFCENIAFDTHQISRVFDVAAELGLPVKLHAEQLTHQGGTQLACRFGALSVDHLEYAITADIEAMSSSDTVAVLLPGAFYSLRETQVPPIDAIRRFQVPMAIATDCNPGSSAMTSILLAMNMACTLFGLTPLEALNGVTVNAAKALGLSDVGSIKPGMRADLSIWNIEEPAELAYRIGFNPLAAQIYQGSFTKPL